MNTSGSTPYQAIQAASMVEITKSSGALKIFHLRVKVCYKESRRAQLTETVHHSRRRGLVGLREEWREVWSMFFISRYHSHG